MRRCLCPASSQEQISEAFFAKKELYKEFAFKIKLWIITLEGKTPFEIAKLH